MSLHESLNTFIFRMKLIAKFLRVYIIDMQYLTNSFWTVEFLSRCLSIIFLLQRTWIHFILTFSIVIFDYCKQAMSKWFVKIQSLHENPICFILPLILMLNIDHFWNCNLDASYRNFNVSFVLINRIVVCSCNFTCNCYHHQPQYSTHSYDNDCFHNLSKKPSIIQIDTHCRGYTHKNFKKSNKFCKLKVGMKYDCNKNLGV